VPRGVKKINPPLVMDHPNRGLDAISVSLKSR